MKTIFLITLLYSFSLLHFNISAINSTDSKSFQNYNHAEAYKKYAENYLKTAEMYKQKAEKNSTRPTAEIYYRLAEQYKAMANEKFKMSEAFETGNKNLYNQANTNYLQLKAELKQLNANKEKLKYTANKYSKSKYNNLSEEGKSKQQQILRLKKQLAELQDEIENLEKK